MFWNNKILPTDLYEFDTWSLLFVLFIFYCFYWLEENVIKVVFILIWNSLMFSNFFVFVRKISFLLCLFLPLLGSEWPEFFYGVCWDIQWPSSSIQGHKTESIHSLHLPTGGSQCWGEEVGRLLLEIFSWMMIWLIFCVRMLHSLWK